jgi:alpha-ketoglutarate-dependent taurine dioxygenase
MPSGRRSLKEREMSQSNIEDIYPLSPAQEGILFHHLSSAGTGVYCSQNSFTLRNLNPPAFEQAWRQVINRHPILRTAFVWSNLPKPHQVVGRKAALRLTVQDWRGIQPEEQSIRLGKLALADRRQGFHPSRAPLMRLTLFRLDRDRYRFLWSHHHLLLDGWSVFLILKEVAAFYHAYVNGWDLSLKQPRPFRDYIGWLHRQDDLQAESYWRRTLTGFTEPLSLGDASRRAERQEQKLEQSIRVSPETFRRLQALTRSSHLTLNTLAQGTWALILSHLGRKKDVVFGATVSGRPPNLAGVESMIGIFINILPMRVRIAPSDGLLPWLKTIQDQRVEASQYEHIALSQIQRWSDAPRGRAMFESLLSFENYPVQIDDETIRLGRNLEAQDFRWDSESNFPLTIIIAPRAGLELKIAYDADRFTKDSIRRLLRYFICLLDSIAVKTDVRLGELAGALTKLDRELEQGAPARKDLKRSVKPRSRAGSFSPREMVSLGFPESGQSAPLIIRPAVRDVALAEWVKEQRALIEHELSHHGAILFRGFGIKSPTEFEQVAAAICPHLFLEYGDAPHDGVSGNVYSPTAYPADKAILFRNQSSHLRQWPMKIWFYCAKSVQTGGEIRLVDCRRVYQSLDARIRERFQNKNLLYIRNFTSGSDVGWQSFFQTENRGDVESICREHGIDFEWKDGDRLQTRRLRGAVAAHPKTGEMVFFNQVQLHHPFCSGESRRKSLRSIFSEDESPRNVYYGDGSPIEESALQEIGRVYQENAVLFPWQEGDILMLDNMLTAHGRNPDLDVQKIVAAAGEMFACRDLEN